MVTELNQMYDAGAITAHHFAVECLHMVDPSQPALVLDQIPNEVLASIQQFANHYDPQRMKTNYGVVPTADQVASATRWIHEHRTNHVQ